MNTSSSNLPPVNNITCWERWLVKFEHVLDIKHGNESNQSQWFFHRKFYGTRGFTLVSQVLCPYVYQFHPPKLRLITPNEHVVVANILAWPWPKMRLESTKGGFWSFILRNKTGYPSIQQAMRAFLHTKRSMLLMSSIPSIKFQWYLIYPSKSRQINYSWYQRAFIHNWTSDGDKITSNHLPPNANVTGPLSSRTWSSLSFESCCGSLPLERNEQLRSFLQGIYDLSQLCLSNPEVLSVHGFPLPPGDPEMFVTLPCRGQQLLRLEIGSLPLPWLVWEQPSCHIPVIPVPLPTSCSWPSDRINLPNWMQHHNHFFFTPSFREIQDIFFVKL